MSEQVFNNVKAAVATLMNRQDTRIGFLKDHVLNHIFPIVQEIWVDITVEEEDALGLNVTFNVYDDDTAQTDESSLGNGLSSALVFTVTPEGYEEYLVNLRNAVEPLLLLSGPGDGTPWLDVMAERDDNIENYSYSNFGIATNMVDDDADTDDVATAEEIARDAALSREVESVD